MTFGTFLDTTGMVEAAVRRDELLCSSPVLPFFFLGWKGRGRGIRRTEKKLNSWDCPFLLPSVGLLAPYVDTYLKTCYSRPQVTFAAPRRKYSCIVNIASSHIILKDHNPQYVPLRTDFVLFVCTIFSLSQHPVF
jgi:hypothetical protein